MPNAIALSSNTNLYYATSIREFLSVSTRESSVIEHDQH